MSSPANAPKGEQVVDAVQRTLHEAWSHAEMIEWIKGRWALSRGTQERAAIRFLMCELANHGDLWHEVVGSGAAVIEAIANEDTVLVLSESSTIDDLHKPAAAGASDATTHEERVPTASGSATLNSPDELAASGASDTCKSTEEGRPHDNSHQSTSRLQQLPSEIHGLILEHLYSLPDVRSLVSASRCFRDLFTSKLASALVTSLLPKTIYCSDRHNLDGADTFCTKVGFRAFRSMSEMASENPNTPSATERAHDLLALASMIIDFADVRLQQFVQDKIVADRKKTRKGRKHAAKSMEDFYCDDRITIMTPALWQYFSLIFNPEHVFRKYEREKLVQADEVEVYGTVAKDMEGINFFIACATAKTAHSTLLTHPTTRPLNTHMDDLKWILAPIMDHSIEVLQQWAMDNLRTMDWSDWYEGGPDAEINHQEHERFVGALRHDLTFIRDEETPPDT